MVSAFRVIVCGGRDYDDRWRMRIGLDRLRAKHPDLHLVVGYDPSNLDFQGADQLAYEWAKEEGVPVQCFPAEWGAYGRRGRGDPAGPIRNQRMLDEGKPHAVVALPGGRGTRDMTARAEAAGVKVVRVRL